ncbi:MAG: hypothetical protein IJ412_09735 [Oscillospiraceae bacterium]|nr:hypothetical protein [Oscillospiraceae bacterium]
MKKALLFVPSVLVGLIYLFLLFAVGGWQDGENWLGAAAYVLPLLAADLLLAKGKWFGGIPGAAMGIYWIVSYLQQPWPVSNPLNWQLGAAFVVWYLVLAVTVGVKAAKRKKNIGRVNQ